MKILNFPMLLALLLTACASDQIATHEVKSPTIADLDPMKVDCDIPLTDEQVKTLSDYDLKLFKTIDRNFAHMMEVSERVGENFLESSPIVIIQFQQSRNGLIDNIKVIREAHTPFESSCRKVVNSSNFASLGDVPMAAPRKDYRTVTVRFHNPKAPVLSPTN
jgi:hypothetical protein